MESIAGFTHLDTEGFDGVDHCCVVLRERPSPVEVLRLEARYSALQITPLSSSAGWLVPSVGVVNGLMRPHALILKLSDYEPERWVSDRNLLVPPVMETYEDNRQGETH